MQPSATMAAGIAGARTPAAVRAAALGFLLARLALGIIFVAHGSQKLFGWFDGGGLAGTAGMLGQLGLPKHPVLAALVGGTEFFGGLGVLLGLLTRLASLGLIAVMAVAIAKVHGANGFFLNGATGPGFEYNIALIGLAALLLLAGPGPWSLDRDWEGRQLFGRARAEGT